MCESAAPNAAPCSCDRRRRAVNNPEPPGMVHRAGLVEATRTRPQGVILPPVGQETRPNARFPISTRRDESGGVVQALSGRHTILTRAERHLQEGVMLPPAPPTRTVIRTPPRADDGLGGCS